LGHGNSALGRADTTVLEPGAGVVFVSDSNVDSRVGRNAIFHAHLRDRLERGGAVIAEPGSSVQLTVVDKATHADGATVYIIAFSRFRTLAGDLPVAPLTPEVSEIHTGTEFAARTLVPVVDDGTHLRVRIPLPFSLPNDPPQGEFTPIPVRTYAPLVRPGDRRRSRPSPSPATSASPSAAAPTSPSAAPTSPAVTGPTSPPVTGPTSPSATESAAAAPSPSPSS
jgi:hypothetical protein